MVNNFNTINIDENAVEKVIEIDKQIKDEFSKGSKVNEERVTKLMFEQMLRGLYLTQNPII